MLRNLKVKGMENPKLKTMKAIATRRAGKKYYSGTPHYSTAYNSFLEGARWCAKFKKYPRLSAKDSQFQDLENKFRNGC